MLGSKKARRVNPLVDEYWNPTDITDVKEKLGEPRLIFRPDPLRLWTGIVACAVVWSFGWSVAHRLHRNEERIVNTIFGVGLSFLASFALRRIVRSRGLSVLVYEAGFVVVRRMQIAVYSWENIQDVKRRWLDGMFVVRRRDGVKFVYSQDTLKAAGLLTQIIYTSTAARARSNATGPKPSANGTEWRHEMFSDSYQRVMASANQWAEEVCADYVGTEHILLALLEDELSPVVDLCKRLQVGPAAIRAAVAQIIVPGPTAPFTQFLPLTPMARQVTAFAVEEARRLRHDAVAPKHLFLGLLRCEECVAAQALMGLGVSVDDARRSPWGPIENRSSG
jgi:Clp amino terminal domain, pathogenicity island component